jgi:ElaB/YqjD/DUF883 family membrane-anchored ribosome-binding protein
MFARLSSRRSRAHVRHAARTVNRYPAQVANEEIRILLSAVEDLIERLRATADPELRRLSKQTEAALDTVRAAIAESGGQLRDQAAELAERGGTYVRERPWASLGLAAVCLLAIGLWTGRAVMSD